MKKLIALLCMITCIMGLTACGSEPVYTEYEMQKLANAEEYAEQYVVPTFVALAAEEEVQAMLQEYTAEEVSAWFYEMLGFEIDGYVAMTAITSFEGTIEAVGTIVDIEEVTSKIDDKTIIVNVELVGSEKNANAEVILSNDAFLKIKSAALNEESTMSDMMGKAALNTLIGMGTVFVVLILISFIISLFGLIPKMQEKIAKKKEAKKAKANGVDNAIAQIVEAEENVEASDDLELVAVIAAAIAAYEGAGSTDGFVVRSIRKVNRAR